MNTRLQHNLSLRVIIAFALFLICFFAVLHNHRTRASAPSAGQLQFSVSAYTVRRGDTATITVTRTGGTDGTVTVNYGTHKSEGRPPFDYVDTNGTLTFLPGQTEQTFTVTTLNNDETETNSVFLSLNSPTGCATLGSPAATYVIITPDTRPLIVLDAIDDKVDSVYGVLTTEYNILENNAGATNAVVAVKLSKPSSQIVTVRYLTTTNGGGYARATPEQDFTPTSGTLTFMPGQTKQTISIPIINDALTEPTESFGVELADATNAVRRGNSFYVKIADNDDDAPASQLQFSSATYSSLEGRGASVFVQRTGSTAGTVSVQYTVTGGTATVGSDYGLGYSYGTSCTTMLTSGTLEFRNGYVNVGIPLILLRDNLTETDETIEITLTNPTGNATLGSLARTVVTIQNETRPTLDFISPYVVEEGDSGIKTVDLIARLSSPSDKTISVDYRFGSIGYLSIAKPNIDFIADPSGTLTFNPGETSKTISVQIIGDTRDENNEELLLDVPSLPVNDILSNYPYTYLYIKDDDPPPTISISDASIVEGTGEFASTLNFTITASDNSDFEYGTDVPSVSLEIADGTATGARNGSLPPLGADFLRDPDSVRFTFWRERSPTSITYRVPIISDDLKETDETFVVRLKSSYFIIAKGKGFGTIIDDDAPNTPGNIKLERDSYSTVEGNARFPVKVEWSGNTAGASVRYTTVNGTAQAGVDYVPVSGILTFSPAVRLQTIELSILKPPGARPDAPKTLRLILSDPTDGATLGTPDAAAISFSNSIVFPGDILISEFRLRGSRGARDEFIELYNNTDTDIVLGYSGFSLYATSLFNGVSISNLRIPSRGHLLVTNDFNDEGYSLGTLARGDISFNYNSRADISDRACIGLYQSQTARHIDTVCVGDPSSNSYSREGTPLTPVSADGEHSFVRRNVNGRPQDTNDNAADFVLVSTTGGMFGSTQSVLGAPGAENLSSPVANVPPIVRVEKLDRRVSIENPPNMVRDATPVVNGSRGTILMRRTLINDGDAPLTQLRFRIINLPTLGGGDTNVSGATQADLRALSSSGARVTLSDGSVVEVVGLTLEEPSQPLGGGLNSTLAVGTITMASPLKAGASVNVELRFGVERTGRYRIGLSLERDANIGGRRSMRGRTRSASQAK